jgi:sterile alpha motif and leucine zipper-containing kinase AZK
VAQARKVAADVARGMAHLHTAFEVPGAVRSHKPIIHRDLKSPNLLLVRAPVHASSSDGSGGADEELGAVAGLHVKVADFGLSRDKAYTDTGRHTLKMSGCGSMLWMAPEMLLGDRYNESVDVYLLRVTSVRAGILNWLRFTLRF